MKGWKGDDIDREYKGYYIRQTQGKLWTLERINATIEEWENEQYPEFKTLTKTKQYIDKL